jgi:CO/xanthine dehydrogenase FAD-binding subunit
MTAAGFHVPHSLEEAVKLLDIYAGELTVLGGGTIVMGLVNDGALFPRHVMSLARSGLDGITERDGYVFIGAATTIAAIAARRDLGILSEAAALIGGPAVRNTATLGGNLCARAPYGDLAVPLLAFDAQIELTNTSGSHTEDLKSILANLDTAAGVPARELLTTVSFPKPAGVTAYQKLGRRLANTPTVVSVAVRLNIDATGACREARVALGGAGHNAMRSAAAEAVLVGQHVDTSLIEAAAGAAMAECDPPTDALATAWYRRKMVGAFVRRTLERALIQD